MYKKQINVDLLVRFNLKAQVSFPVTLFYLRLTCKRGSPMEAFFASRREQSSAIFLVIWIDLV